MSSYFMPAKDGIHETTVSKSRFICHVYRVHTLQEANAHIQKIRDIHDRANHNCVAYLIGENNEYGRAADDGEPSGTAGAPMLDVLQRQNIRNCLVIVTRYFGGVKLGAGGLIRAYGSAVSEGLKATGLVRRIKMRSMWLTCDYAVSETLQSKLVRASYAVGHIEYTDRVRIETLVELDQTDAFCAWLIETTHNTVTCEAGDVSFKEIPV